MRLTVFTGMAKPMPEEAPLGLYIAVFTPTNCPNELSKGPPEFPGLIAASVWITSRIVRLFTDSISLPSALTTPTVMVVSSPNGLPIAITFLPTSNKEESPRLTGVSSTPGASMRSTARSLSGSDPTGSAS